MSEEQKKIIKDLADKLPSMTERERGYLEGTIATAAAMSMKDKALNVQSRFSRWFDTNKELFIEGEDFNKCTSSTVVNNGAIRQLEDYEITVLMAKHLAMMSST